MTNEQEGLVEETNPIVPSIELDCEPMCPRPDTLIEGVLEDTNVKHGEPVSKVFGCWTWTFPEVSTERWINEVAPKVKPRIIALYKNGLIRYGSW